MNLRINLANFRQPATLVAAYLIGLSCTFLLVDDIGQSTLIDEIFLLLIFPMALVGGGKLFWGVGAPAKLISLYFLVALTSSIVTLGSRTGVPLAAPALGLLLDAKFLIFLGALLYLFKRGEENGEDSILSICKSILFVGLVNSPFFLRDIVSDGRSLLGISLAPSNLFGYVPVGLFSHKVATATLSAMSFASAATLYFFTARTRLMLAVILFSILLLWSWSTKELVVLLAAILVIFRSLKGRESRVSRSGRQMLVLAILVAPLVAFLFGAYLDRLVSSRVEVYLFEETARAALHVKSMEIASDYFPFGSGAGTFSSQPSRSIYFSPLYYEYGMHHFYGASEAFSSFLMDVGWPKFIAEAGWLGGGAYFLAYLIVFLRVIKSFAVRPTVANVFGLMLGALIFSSAFGAAIFTSDLGVLLCALLFFCAFVDRRCDGQRLR